MMITKKSINIPIFNQEVIILIGDKEEIVHYLSDIYATDQLQDLITSGFYAACCKHNGLPHIIMSKNEFKMSHFIHELSHAAYCIMDWVGLDLTDEEAFCYLLQYIYEQCEPILPIQMEVVSKMEDQEDEQVSS